MNKFIIAYLSFFTFLPLSSVSQSIEGLWKVTKGTTEITMEIKGSSGKVIALNSTKDFTDKIIGGTLYDNIVSLGTSKWKANRYTWRYNGTSRQEQESGWWTQVADSELSLSEDGNTLTASGHWTWKRVNPFKQEGTTSSTVATNESVTQKTFIQSSKALFSVDVNYEGVKITYTVLLNSTSNDTIVIAKMLNTHSNLGARVIFANSTSKLGEMNLDPGNKGIFKIEEHSFEILVEFYPYEYVEKPLSEELINWSKNKVKGMIKVEKNGEIHQTTVTGIRG